MDIARIEAAADRLGGNIRRTPLLASPALDAMAGRRILVKAECLQHTGSFKARGGWSAVSALDPDARARGVLAYSSGNHAQGVARAARAFGAPAVIVMPADAPAAKRDGTRALGAEVVPYDRFGEAREEIGNRLANERGLSLVKPYDDPEVIAGQGTTGLEIAQQAAGCGVAEAEVLVCCGGGGLSAGIALALESKALGMTVRTVEPEGYDDVARSLSAGAPQRNMANTPSLCDAILTPQPGQLTFPILQRLCGAGLAVSEDEALRAMALAFTHLKVVAEPGGAVALAAALFHGAALNADTVICTISGGNVDPAVFAKTLETAR